MRPYFWLMCISRWAFLAMVSGFIPVVARADFLEGWVIVHY